MALIPVTPGQLPSGLCPTSFQEMLNSFSAHQSVDVSAATGSGLVVSATKPTTGVLPWLRLDAFGRPERVYWFASGAWLALHPIVPGLTQWWFAAVPNFTTFDGGDANALSAISGAMWELAKRPDGTVIAAQFPIAAGTLASGTVLAAGDIGGEEKHVLTLNEMPKHVHQVVTSDASCAALTSSNSVAKENCANQAQTYDYRLYGSATDPTTGKTSVAGDDQGHQNLPPYVVGYLLSRTNRLFYAIA